MPVSVKIDRKTVVFLGSFATTMFTVLYPVGKEVWDALRIYTADPIDWTHIWTTHGPAVITTAGLFWQTMRARDMVPAWLSEMHLEDAVGVLQDIKSTNAANALAQVKLPENPIQAPKARD